MKYKSKTNRINNESGAILALRIIDTVTKSGIEDALTSKSFTQLVDVNSRYQIAIEPSNDEQIKLAIKNLFNNRGTTFSEIHSYTEGMLNSPDAEMKEAAKLLFDQINKYGRNFSNLKIADQSLRYIRIIEGLKRPEYQMPLMRAGLTEKVALLDQTQLEYEDLYMGRGNNSAKKVAPSNLRKELNDSIKMYMDEVNWLTNRMDTEEWDTLRSNLQKRFDEVNVSTKKQTTDSTLPTAATTTTK